MITHEAAPNNHLYLSYEYSIEKRVYSGTGYAPGHADLHKGEPVEVHFFPSAPAEAVIASKREQQGYAVFGLLAGALMGVFAGLLDNWRLRVGGTAAKSN